MSEIVRPRFPKRQAPELAEKRAERLKRQRAARERRRIAIESADQVSQCRKLFPWCLFLEYKLANDNAIGVVR